MVEEQLTPPEAAVLEAESPLRLTRIMDMFLSRHDFDPGRYDEEYQEDIRRIEAKREDVEKVSRQSAHARRHAMLIIQRTNDLSDTLRRVR